MAIDAVDVRRGGTGEGAARAPGQPQPHLEALSTWLTPDVPTGYELRTTPRLAAQIPGWTADHWGNL